MARARRLFPVVAVGVLVAVAAAGCHKKVPQPTAAPSSAPPPPARAGANATPPPPPPRPVPPPAPISAMPTRVSDEEIFARKSLEQLNAEHPLSDVFFDLDKSEIRDDARDLLTRDADWLKKFPSVKVMVEGHCDSRGSSEYNLALGSRRADAVKDYLVNLGVPGDRLIIVSKGKEQPFCTDENDACWQQNRRAQFALDR